MAATLPLHSVPGAIVAVGSHDMTLDLLGDYLHRRHPEVTLVSAHVGSLGGLLALQRNEAHLAGSHLLDRATGEYNKAFIERLLSPYGCHVVLLGFVSRQQGLILARKNPKRISSVEDLARDDVQFINRQQGAGTRISWISNWIVWAFEGRTYAATNVRSPRTPLWRQPLQAATLTADSAYAPPLMPWTWISFPCPTSAMTWSFLLIITKATCCNRSSNWFAIRIRSS